MSDFKIKLDKVIKDWKTQSLQEGLNNYIEMILDAAICSYKIGNESNAKLIMDGVSILLKYTKEKPIVQAWDSNTHIQNYIQTRIID